MKVVILGSGLMGVSTAYELGKRGFDVTVLERNEESARETSFANGGQLSYTHAEPWPTPAVLKKLPKWLFRSDAPLVFRPRADMDMVLWGLKFLSHCRSSHAHISCVNILRLGLYSKEKMDALRAETNIQFDAYSGGILHIFSTQEDFDYAKKQYEFQAKFGGEHRVLTREKCLALEPSLAYTSRVIVGGIHAIPDEIGDSYMFCNALAKIAAERYGVKFEYGVNVTSLRTEKKVVCAAVTDKGEFAAEGFVMAMGSYSPLFLKPLGMRVPIYPMKGYSITLEANEFCPKASITDGSHKIVYTRMGKWLRVAGTAEFAGYDTTINPKRTEPMIAATKAMFPKANWEQTIDSWACLRPSTPDGPPVLGRTPYANLFLNTGHGTLGWTHVAGSASIVADIMERKTPEILLNGFTLERFV